MSSTDTAGSNNGHDFDDLTVRDAASPSAAARLAVPPARGSWSVDDLPLGFLALVGDRAFTANAQWSRLSGLASEDSVGEGWWRSVQPEDRDRVAAAVRLAAGGDQVVDWRVVGPEPRWVRAHVHPTIGRGGACVMMVTELDPPRAGPAVVAPGISAGRDSLTGLLDRAAFLAEAARVVDQASAGGGLRAVLFVDLDHFKDVNDSHGHLVGDRVLVAVCRRVQSVLRVGDSLGRLGGDELAVLVPSISAPEEASQLAERIVRACDDVFTIDGVTVQAGVSVGVAFSGVDARASTDVIHNADRAMYRAKAEGRGRWSMFALTPGAPPRDHKQEALATVDEASRAIIRAEWRITALWRDVINLRDDPFSTSLVDVSHALHRAARVLARHAERHGAGPTRSAPPAGVHPARTIIGTGSDAPDPGRASDAPLTTATEEPVIGPGQSTEPGDLVPEPGGVTAACDGDGVRLRLWGEHDVSTVGILGTALVEAIAAYDLDVVIDLRDVTFMDGSTVWALVHGRALLAGRDRRLTVQHPSPSQRRLLQVCDLADLIEPAPVAEAAQGQRAATPLATWVEVPPTVRATEVLRPAKVDAASDDTQRSRR